MAKRGVFSYKKTQATTAGPGQRLVMVYDGIIKNMKQAQLLMRDMSPENIELINKKLQLAQRLILELRLALDKNVGGELAEKLEGLYFFWTEQISQANIKKDPDMLTDTIAMASELRDSWEQADRETRRTGM